MPEQASELDISLAEMTSRALHQHPDDVTLQAECLARMVRELPHSPYTGMFTGAYEYIAAQHEAYLPRNAAFKANELTQSLLIMASEVLGVGYREEQP